jgi:hypothetical protein
LSLPFRVLTLMFLTHLGLLVSIMRFHEITLNSLYVSGEHENMLVTDGGGKIPINSDK